MIYHAAARGIAIGAVSSELEGDIDVRGFMGLAVNVRKGYSRVRVKMNVESAAPAETLETLAKFSPVYDIVSNALHVEVSVARHRYLAACAGPGRASRLDSERGAPRGSDSPVYDIEPNSLPVEVLVARRRYLAACSGPASNPGSGRASRLDSECGAPGGSGSPVCNIVSNWPPVEGSV